MFNNFQTNKQKIPMLDLMIQRYFNNQVKQIDKQLLMINTEPL